VLLDRCDDAVRWGLDPGYEFPGAEGAVSVVEDPAGDRCLRLDYDFTGGGNYVTAAFGLVAVSQASVVAFSVRQEGGNEGFVRVRDATEQEHAGGYTAGPEWTRVVIPLDLEHFGGHWHGPNDGQFHFPLNRILIGVTKGPAAKGAVFIKDLAILTEDAASFYRLTLTTPDPGNAVFCSPRGTALALSLENRIARPARLALRGTVRGWHGEVRTCTSRPSRMTRSTSSPVTARMTSGRAIRCNWRSTRSMMPPGLPAFWPTTASSAWCQGRRVGELS
jgi:hypothetical protein